jgi:serine protease Do
MKKLLLTSILLVLTAALAEAAGPNLKLSDPLPANLFVELAKVINPAVVNISTKTMPKFRNGPHGGPNGGGPRDPFFDMLEQFYGMQMQPQMQVRPQQALGTGFIIREDGLIVTNNHVIAGADLIQVQLTEKTEKLYEAKLIGSDERTDIALIKIESKEKLPVAQLGNSNDLEVGEWVAAFGNPFGNGHTMTKGIISAKGRDIGEINKFPLIQTDAPINPGNSGGPLVNTKGFVVGVNSAIDARAQGIGFAIPIDEVKTIIPQLEKSGRIRKGYLGVGLGDLDETAASQLGLKDSKGAVIVQVEKKGPAAKAGLQPYDIVIEFNGRKIQTSTELRDSVADTQAGTSVPVKIIREGKNKTINVAVSERPEEPRGRQKSPSKKYFGQKAPMDLGFMISDANETLRKDFDLPDDLEKPVVIEVTPGTPAARSGLQPGDVILDVNRKEVSSTTQVLKQLRQGANTLRVSRGPAVAILVIQ